MIEFECPACGEPMAIRDRMAGREVRCTDCDRWVEVPEESQRRRRRRPDDPGLSGGELALYFLLFLCVPFACVLVSSILYYVWKADRPKRANQINMLGFLVVGINILATAAYYVLAKKA